MNQSFPGLAGRDALARYVPADGWLLGKKGLWEYSSADAPVYVVNVPDKDAEIISVGMRARWYQPSIGYGIVHAIGASAAGTTPITIYAGTDYSLTASVGIEKPAFSPIKAPYGFPLDPSKWTVTLSDTTDVNTDPAADTWYNLGSLSLNIPIGSWNTFYSLALEARITTAAVGVVGARATLSTANNSASDTDFVKGYIIFSPIGAVIHRLNVTSPTKIITLATKTTHYLNALSSQDLSSIRFRGDIETTKVKCVCAYL